MNTRTWFSTFVITIVLGTVVVTGGRQFVNAWQGEEDERPERVVENDIDAEQLERRLDEIEEQLERAEQDGNDDRVRELRREGERILDKLEQLERSREEDEGEFEGEEFELERRELEMHRLHLEIERLQAELNALGQESAVRLAELARDETTSAAYAIQQAATKFEEEHAREFLTDLMEEVENDTVKRVIRHRLAQLSFNMDEPEEALQQLKSLILAK
jgi:chromosome segregation ATPase